MTLRIRPLRENDFENGFLETLSHLSSVKGMPLQKAKQVFRKISKNPFYHFFVAELDGRIVGTATLLVEQKFFRNLGKVAHLENVATREGFEGRGIGGALVKHSVEFAKKKKCYKIILDCNDKLVYFYGKFGFKTHDVGMRMDMK